MPDTFEMHRLDASGLVGADELCHACRITVEELREIVAYGAPLEARMRGDWSFGADWVLPLREAARMARDFDLDLFAVSVLAQKLHRIDELEREVRELRARMPR